MGPILVVYKLKTISINIDEEYKGLRIIWSLSSFYENIKRVLIYGKETLNFKKVVSKIIFEDERLKSEDNTSLNSVLVIK